MNRLELEWAIMTPEQFNIIITVLQDISSSIQFVGEMLILVVVAYIVNGFMK